MLAPRAVASSGVSINAGSPSPNMLSAERMLTMSPGTHNLGEISYNLPRSSLVDNYALT